jgi:hypothetical protein
VASSRGAGSIVAVGGGSEYLLRLDEPALNTFAWRTGAQVFEAPPTVTALLDDPRSGRLLILGRVDGGTVALEWDGASTPVPVLAGSSWSVESSVVVDPSAGRVSWVDPPGVVANVREVTRGGTPAFIALLSPSLPRGAALQTIGVRARAGASAEVDGGGLTGVQLELATAEGWALPWGSTDGRNAASASAPGPLTWKVVEQRATNELVMGGQLGLAIRALGPRATLSVDSLEVVLGYRLTPDGGVF